MEVDLLVTAAMVFGRIAGLLAGMPLISSNGVPRSAQMLTAIALTVLVAPGVGIVSSPSLGELGLALAGELLLGSIMGLALRTVFSASTLASELLSMEIGLGLASVLDPVQKSNSGLLGVLASWLSGLAFLGLGLHRQCIEIVAASFSVAPAGMIGNPAATTEQLVEAVAMTLSLGVQLAGPVLALVWSINVLIALIAKLAPKMNMFFSIGLTATSTAGILMFGVALPWFVAAHISALTEMVQGLQQIVLAAGP